MSHYRDLNKELIDQVQKMRLDMKMCCGEIIHLKRELMEKHEAEINLRKQCYSWAVDSFVQLLQSVQPDSDILPILKEYVHPDDTTSSPDVRDRRSRITGGRSSEARRSSSMLAREMRRSNSVMNARKSIRTTSPIRRNSKEIGDEVEEEQNSQYDQHDAEGVNVASVKTNNNQQLINSPINIIYEDFEEEEEDEVFDVDSVCESIDELDCSQAKSTLKDVTNILTAERNSSQQENIVSKSNLKQTHAKKGKFRKLRGQENTTASMGNNKDVSETEEETLQEPRRYSKEHKLFTKRSIPINSGDSVRDIEASVNSPTLVYTDITLRNFKNAACSTPNSLHNSTSNNRTPPKKIEYVPDLTSATTSMSSINISGRPTRQCKPTNLAEPKLGQKLRNESETDLKKQKRKNRSRSKSKK